MLRYAIIFEYVITLEACNAVMELKTFLLIYTRPVLNATYVFNISKSYSYRRRMGNGYREFSPSPQPPN